MIVSNSTPLIGLAKIGRLDLLRELFGTVFIPAEVKAETVDAGLANKAPDAYVIGKAIEEGWIVVQETPVLSKLADFGIDIGEAAALSLAKTRGEKEVLVDERHARLAAKALGLKPLGTIYVLLSALKEGHLSHDEYQKALEDLVKSGFRLSEEVYMDAARMGLEIRCAKEV
jgi:predicted nucleic acid-binding protein